MALTLQIKYSQVNELQDWSFLGLLISWHFYIYVFKKQPSLHADVLFYSIAGDQAGFFGR